MSQKIIYWAQFQPFLNNSIKTVAYLMHPLACHHWSKLTVSAITERQRVHQGHSRKKKNSVAPFGNFKV